MKYFPLSHAGCVEVQVVPEDYGSDHHPNRDEVVDNGEEHHQLGLAKPFGRIRLADEDVAEDGDGDRDDAVEVAEEVGCDQGQQAVGGVVGGLGLVETVINEMS